MPSTALSSSNGHIEQGDVPYSSTLQEITLSDILEKEHMNTSQKALYTVKSMYNVKIMEVNQKKTFSVTYTVSPNI